MEKGISVIIPVYNAEKYIEETITCLLNQTYNEFELIIVNDGSTDQSPTIIEHMAKRDARIKVVHQKNGGVSLARNTGLDVATKEFVAFVDHDDYVVENYLETLAQHAEEYDLCVSGYYSISRNNLKKIGPKGYFRSSVREAIEAHNYNELANKWTDFDKVPSVLSTVWAKLFRTFIIKKYNLTFKQTSAEDHLFCYSYYCHIESMRQISWGGYYHIEDCMSLGSSHKYIADILCIHEMQELYEDMITRFNITDERYLSNLRWRAMNRYTSLALKGYHKDTRLPMKKRLRVWGGIAKEEWLKKTKLHDILGFRRLQIVYVVCRCRLYYLVDPIMYLIVNHK